MKSILNIIFITFTFLAFQGCGSVPIQTASHIGGSDDRFGSAAVDQSFDQQSDLTSAIGYSQPASEQPEEKSFDQQSGPDIGIILIPVTIHQGFTISYRSLRFCETLLKHSCSYLRQQAGQTSSMPVTYDSPSNGDF